MKNVKKKTRKGKKKKVSRVYQASGSSEQAIFDPGVCFARVKDSDKAPAFLLESALIFP